jgi:hypothetical protein
VSLLAFVGPVGAGRLGDGAVVYVVEAVLGFGGL